MTLMKIIFSGGGTLGPVTPLLAMRETIQQEFPNTYFIWVGTRRGPEKELVEQAGIPFFTLSSGKFRRYLSFWNVTDIFRIVIGFFQSLVLLWKEDPDICISAGGFISVPLHWAAWFLGIPTWIHQQDIRVGLANKLMVPFATIITTSLERQLKEFPKKKTMWLGNPIRSEVFEGTALQARKRFELDAKAPVVFATGGGTGSMKVNQMVVQAVQHLQGKCQIVHLTGKERPQELIGPAQRQFSHYKPYQFFTEEMKDAYAVADVVISRGGFGTLTELAALKKPAILVPKEGHQQENVRFLEEANAAELVNEKTSDGNYLAKVVKELLEDADERKKLGERLHAMLPPAKKEKIIEIIGKLT